MDIELSTGLREISQCTENAPSRHYAKQEECPRALEIFSRWCEISRSPFDSSTYGGTSLIFDVKSFRCCLLTCVPCWLYLLQILFLLLPPISPNVGGSSSLQSLSARGNFGTKVTMNGIVDQRAARAEKREEDVFFICVLTDSRVISVIFQVMVFLDPIGSLVFTL